MLIVNYYYVTESFSDLGIVNANLSDYANYVVWKLEKDVDVTPSRKLKLKPVKASKF